MHIKQGTNNKSYFWFRTRENKNQVLSSREPFMGCPSETGQGELKLLSLYNNDRHKVCHVCLSPSIVSMLIFTSKSQLRKEQKIC